MPYYVYVLQNPQGRLYVGHTNNLERRLDEHQQGLSGWAGKRRPWQLVHHEKFLKRSEAMRRERQFKSGHGREWLASKLNGRAGPPPAD